MSRLRVESVSVSVDGYSAGPKQDLENPLGVNGKAIMGENIFADLNLVKSGYSVKESVSGENATHVIFEKS